MLPVTTMVNLLLAASMVLLTGFGAVDEETELAYTPECAAALEEIEARQQSGLINDVAALGAALDAVPQDCLDARRTAAVQRQAFSFRGDGCPTGGCETANLNLLAISFCGNKSGYQVNAYNYADATSTLFQTPNAGADFDALSQATEAFNEVFNTQTAQYLEAVKEISPGLQNLELTIGIDETGLFLVYALPAAVFDHTMAATESLQVLTGGELGIVQEGGYLLFRESSRAEASFPELVTLRHDLNAAFAELAQDAGGDRALQVAIDDDGLRLEFAS